MLDANALVSAMIRPPGKPAQVGQQRQVIVRLAAGTILAQVAGVLPSPFAHPRPAARRAA